MPRGEMLRRMTGAELNEWAAMWEIDPFGQQRADLRAATVACAVVNSQGGKSRPADFMPDFRDEQEKAQERMERLLKRMKAMARVK